jgi:hypothetical protein
MPNGNGPETALTRSRGARLLNVGDPQERPSGSAFLAPPILGQAGLAAPWYEQAGHPSVNQAAQWIAQGWPGREFALGRMSPTPLYPAPEGSPQVPSPMATAPPATAAGGMDWLGLLAGAAAPGAVARSLPQDWVTAPPTLWEQVRARGLPTRLFPPLGRRRRR